MDIIRLSVWIIFECSFFVAYAARSFLKERSDVIFLFREMEKNRYLRSFPVGY